MQCLKKLLVKNCGADPGLLHNEFKGVGNVGVYIRVKEMQCLKSCRLKIVGLILWSSDALCSKMFNNSFYMRWFILQGKIKGRTKNHKFRSFISKYPALDFVVQMIIPK